MRKRPFFWAPANQVFARTKFPRLQNQVTQTELCFPGLYSRTNRRWTTLLQRCSALKFSKSVLLNTVFRTSGNWRSLKQLWFFRMWMRTSKCDRIIEKRKKLHENSHEKIMFFFSKKPCFSSFPYVFAEEVQKMSKNSTIVNGHPIELMTVEQFSRL